MSALAALLMATALAADSPETALHGDLKVFFVAGQPKQWIGDEADPYGQGVAAGRLRASVKQENVRLDLHWALAAQTVAQASSFGLSTGVGARAPELLPLSWTPVESGGLTFTHRVDRLVLSGKIPHLDLALGRQPVSFGVGRIFTPLDLVNPFHPATIDTEYKPGVDALRIDGYAGMAGKLTLVAAWAGEPVVGEDRRDADTPVLDDLVLAASGQGTVGVTDLLGFAGSVHGEPVFGLGTVSALGPVGIHAEASLTLQEDDPFVRAVAGADLRPTGKTSVMAEAYVQSFGATDPADYLAAASSARFARGELWQLGQLYGALAVSQEITPLVSASVSAIGNLRDPSALLTAGGSWSVADNASVAFGGYLGLGAAPDPLPLAVGADGAVSLPSTETLADSVNSEFGLYPSMLYLQVRTYF